MTKDSGKLFAHSSPSVTCQLIGNSTIIRVFLRYMATTPASQVFASYISTPAWIAGVFPLHIWDWHNSEHRTNNNIELFHATMKRFFAHPHLTIYKFVALFIQLSKCGSYDYDVRAANGHPAPRPNKRYARVNKCFKTFHRNSYTVAGYLSGVANLVPNPLNM